MSVAFRRDGDEEHLEPKFEVPIPPGPNFVTEAGMHLIHKRINKLSALVETLSDESERNTAKRDLRYWRSRLATAELQPIPSGQVVEFGCSVEFLLNGKLRAITIVGHDEAEPSKGRLAFIAPLARAVLGLEVNETADFNGQEDAIEVVKIS